MLGSANHYEILGVKHDASAEEIKKRHKDLLFQLHPDKRVAREREAERLGQSVRPAEEEKAYRDRVDEAWSVLEDPTSRLEYDIKIGLNTGIVTSAHFLSGTSDPQGDLTEEAKELFRAAQSTTDLGDVHDTSEFAVSRSKRPAPARSTSDTDGSEGGSRAKRVRSSRGDLSSPSFAPDLKPPQKPTATKFEHTKSVRCTLQELYTGVRRQVTFRETATRREYSFTVEIPPGCPDREQYVFPGPDESTSLQFRAIVKTKPHDIFERHGDDLVCRQKISLLQALTGFSFTVKTLNSEPRKFHTSDFMHGPIKPGTILPLKGLGMPVSPGKAGDIRVHFEVEFPTHISEEQKAGLKKVFSATSMGSAEELHASLQRCVSRSDLVMAKQVLSEMRAAGVQPNEAALTTLLKAHAEESDLPGTRAVMSQMRAAGMQPDKGTWTTLLNAHVHGPDLSGARAVMDEMCAVGVQADEMTWTALLDAHVRGSDLLGTQTVMKQMRAAGVRPDWATFFKMPLLLVKMSDLAGKREMLEEHSFYHTSNRKQALPRLKSWPLCVKSLGVGDSDERSL
jgi:DnaJ family protein B protein 4